MLFRSDRLVGLYTGALASTQLRDFARAGQATSAAQALVDGLGPAADPMARQALGHLRAQLALVAGDSQQAATALGPLDGNSRANLLLRADVALALGADAELQRSAETLQAWVSEHREDASAWQLLAQTSQKLGQRLRALRAEAESQAALGNLPGAIDRLRAGQQLARGQQSGGSSGRTDFIEASVIDARLRDLIAQRRELLADQRRSSGNSRNAPPPE